MTGDCHVRICESRGAKFPPATRRPKLQSTIDRLEGLALEEKPNEGPSRGVEEMVAELLDLARMQLKALSTAVELSAPDRTEMPTGVAAGVKFDEVTYLLARLRAAANSAVIPGQPETGKLVQLRGIAALLEQALSPMLDKSMFESILR